MKLLNGKILLLFLLVSFVLITSDCTSGNLNKTPLVLIETNMGKIKVKLYDETPAHRDNFLKLVNTHFYDGTLFHRVIKDFMIQGGDPDSKNAPKGARLGQGGPGYTLPAEINRTLFHKKGALAAARERDRVNPEKRSSGSQFYIVQGKKLSDEELDQMEIRINNMLRQVVFFKFYNETLKNDTAAHPDKAQIQQDAALKTAAYFADSLPYKIPENQREVYKSIGGTPHLDQNYTVFGEVVEGLDVLDKIASVPTDDNDRPYTDVRILKMKLVKK